ncbi:MAG: D-alanyl-D-alanine carboxypeptidase family protein [Actinomycetota bacterium]|nr:D-alanyl-D-alanine carboxypeptidase family protein [Actinomycetota bacterium]
MRFTRSASWPKLVGVVLAAALVLGPAVSSDAKATKDPSAERAEVRKKKAALAGQVNTLKATDRELEAALDDLNDHVAGEEARLAEARRAANAADAAHAEAITAVNAKKAEIEALQSKIRDFAVQAFIHPPADDAIAALDTTDPGEAAEKRALLELQNTNDADLLDQMSAAQEDLEVAQKVAEEAKARADAKKSEVAARLAEVESARDQKAAVASEVDSRLERALSEAAGLEALDKQLSEQIRQQQAALAKRSGGGGGGRGGSSGPVGNVNTSIVNCPNGGRLSVASSIAGSVQSLLDEAAGTDASSLCGGGYRSSQAQIDARRRNGCPDIYDSPPSSCRTPTARPGQSMHERGLAIDFTCNGSIIGSRSGPCWNFLSANAGKYGLRNLPSEPWHWSTNGN